MSISLVFLIVAAICFLLATVNFPSRINLVAFGLLFLTLMQLIGTRGIAL